MRAKPLKAPRVTVIVPVEPDGDPRPCLRALRRLDWPVSKLEVLVARGRQPSRQRNLSAKKARGRWLLFLDSDSEPRSDLLRRLLQAAAEFGAEAAGGPNVAPLAQAFWARAFSAVQGSYFGSMSSRARYAPVGTTRLSGEKELILCNLAVRRDAFEALGGFREDLYPNEENEFLNRFKGSGRKCVYVPGAQVIRPRRPGVPQFARQAYRYGRGRMLQIRANFHPADLANLIQLAGLALLFPLPALAERWPAFWALPASYTAAALASALGIAYRGGVQLAPAALILFPLRHFAYGLGLLSGIFAAAPSSGAGHPIVIEKVRP
jgi:succinoglycan biosynthesis protein ExoA